MKKKSLFDEKLKKSVNIDGAEVEFYKDDSDKLFAKHPNAKLWKPVSKFEDTNPEFWKKAVKQYKEQYPLESKTEKEKKLETYAKRKELLEERVVEEHKKWNDEADLVYNTQKPVSLIEAEDALDKFNETYKNLDSFISSSEKLKKDYSVFIPDGKEKNILNAAEASLKQNDEHITKEY